MGCPRSIDPDNANEDCSSRAACSRIDANRSSMPSSISKNLREDFEPRLVENELMDFPLLSANEHRDGKDDEDRQEI